MLVLPDRLAPRLPLVVCGTAVGDCAAERGHHFSARGDAFWTLLHQAGLTPALLVPTDDEDLPEHGVGLASLVQTPGAPTGFDVPDLAARLATATPQWVAFNGLVAATAVARAHGQPRPHLGPQAWRVAGAEVFVLPSSSGVNRRRDYGGRPTRLAWWSELADRMRDTEPTR
ncbi:mismatch-specific DNA-glycosylase [Myroides odoratimimus subsp. xuanwuensis]